MPDYYSEENWEEFIHLLPNEQLATAPTYSEAAKSLDDMEAELHRRGLKTVRVKVHAAEWKSWVESNNEVMRRESVGLFAMQMYVKQLHQ
jgi:hypothetical protein